MNENDIERNDSGFIISHALENINESIKEAIQTWLLPELVLSYFKVGRESATPP